MEHMTGFDEDQVVKKEKCRPDCSVLGQCLKNSDGWRVNGAQFA
ncbi:hypothetical protein [Comamonas fluminis]|nr:hypothetical protein [Comamonas fluminis]